jgi:hypothetical protein
MILHLVSAGASAACIYIGVHKGEMPLTMLGIVWLVINAVVVALEMTPVQIM